MTDRPVAEMACHSDEPSISAVTVNVRVINLNWLSALVGALAGVIGMMVVRAWG